MNNKKFFPRIPHSWLQDSLLSVLLIFYPKGIPLILSKTNREQYIPESSMKFNAYVHVSSSSAWRHFFFSVPAEQFKSSYLYSSLSMTIFVISQSYKIFLIELRIKNNRAFPKIIFL